MKLTYRTRKNLRTFGIAAGCILLAGTLVWLCWLVWLQRFIVYSDGQAQLDFDWERTEEPVEAVYETGETVAIHVNDASDSDNHSRELTQLSGYYVTIDDLLTSVDAVEQALKALPSGSVVMLDLKSAYGTFYYSSGLAEGYISDKLDVEAVDRLIANLVKTDYYVIARVAALRDRAYGLNHTNYGLAHTSGKYLWYDEQNYYYLDPTKAGTLDHLTDTARELKDLGFDEVVFTEFRFPDTTDIIFDGDRSEALAQAARTLVDECATGTFAVSFETSDATLRIPEGRSRLYLTGVEAMGIQSAVETAAVTDAAIHLVFVTESNDTRYNAYGVMRPILLSN